MLESSEQEITIKIENVKKLQLLVGPDFYKNNDNVVLTNVKVKGKFFQCITGHHHGDQLEVTELIEKKIPNSIMCYYSE